MPASKESQAGASDPTVHDGPVETFPSSIIVSPQFYERLKKLWEEALEEADEDDRRRFHPSYGKRSLNGSSPEKASTASTSTLESRETFCAR